MSEHFDMPALQASWQDFNPMARLCSIHAEVDYDRTVKMMNALLDVAGDAEDHPLSSLLGLVADLASRYEQEHHPIEAAVPKYTL